MLKQYEKAFLGLFLGLFWGFSVAAETAPEKNGGDPLLQQVEQLIQAGQWAEAEKQWRTLEGRVPRQRWAYNLALILTREGKLEEAAHWLEQALQVRQPEAQIWQALKQIRTAQVQQAYAQVFNDQTIKTPDMHWLKVVQLQPQPVAVSAVREALEGWRKAWSAQDVEAYLDYYAADFRPVSGLSHQAWVKQRHQRLTRPKFIQVSLANIQITPLTPNRVETLFEQTYRSDRIHDKVRKRLLWAHTPSGWKIIREVVLP